MAAAIAVAGCAGPASQGRPTDHGEAAGTPVDAQPTANGMVDLDFTVATLDGGTFDGRGLTG